MLLLHLHSKERKLQFLLKKLNLTFKKGRHQTLLHSQQTLITLFRRHIILHHIKTNVKSITPKANKNTN